MGIRRPLAVLCAAARVLGFGALQRVEPAQEELPPWAGKE
jgi:hypothetical protein